MAQTPSTYRVKATDEVGRTVRWHLNGPTQGYLVSDRSYQVSVTWLLFEDGSVRGYESSAIEAEDWVGTP